MNTDLELGRRKRKPRSTNCLKAAKGEDAGELREEDARPLGNQEREAVLRAPTSGQAQSMWPATTVRGLGSSSLQKQC